MKNKGLKDSLDIYKNNKNNPNSKEINDEIEYDLDNQIEVQKIRNERRAVISTMYQLKPESKRLKEEINIENIEYSLEESSIDSIENIIELMPEKGSNNKNNNIDNEIKEKNRKEDKPEEESEIKKEQNGKISEKKRYKL